MAKQTKGTKKIQSEISDVQKSISDIDKEFSDVSKDIATARRVELQTLREMYELKNKILAQELDYAKLVNERKKASRDAKKTEKETYDIAKLVTDAKKKANDLTNTQKKIEDSIKDIEKEIAGYTGDHADEVKNILREKKKQLENLHDINQAELDNLKMTDEQRVAQEKLTKAEEKAGNMVRKNLGFIDDIQSKIKDIPIVGNIVSKALGLDTLKEELSKKLGPMLLKTGKTASNAFKSAGGGIKGIVAGTRAATIGARGMMAALSGGPVTLAIAAVVAAMTILVKKAYELDKKAIDISKSLGLGKFQGRALGQELRRVALSTNVIGAGTEELIESYKDLTNLTGQNVVANTELLETQTLLKNQYGLTGESAADLELTARGLNRTTEQLVLGVEQMVAGYNQLTGDSINQKAIVKDIASITKSTLASYKGNVRQLTLAAIQARKLGMTLEDTAAVADKLLSIETSIENEFKASVLTGKSMNMNAARLLALQGLNAEAAAEAVKQAGSYEDIMNMIPLQQKAVADAAGVTVDQLVKAAELQKFSRVLNGKEIKDMKDLTAEDIKRLETMREISPEKAKELLRQNQLISAQDRINQLQEKFMILIANSADGLMPLIDGLSQIVRLFSKLTEYGGVFGVGAFSQIYNLVGASIEDSESNELTGFASGGMVSRGGLAVVGEEGPEIVNLPTGAAVASNTDSNSFATANGEIVSLLKELITKIDQPVRINIDGRVVDEIEKQTTLRKTYNTKVDSGYGAFG